MRVFVLLSLSNRKYDSFVIFLSLGHETMVFLYSYVKYISYHRKRLWVII